MSGTTRAPKSAINYDEIEEQELRKHVEDIIVNDVTGFPNRVDPGGKKTALKADFLKNIKHNEISETYARALGFATTTPEGTMKEKIPLTWRFRKISQRMNFRIVAAGKYDLVLGEDACFKLAEIGSSLAPVVIDKGAKGSHCPLSKRAQRDRR